MDPPPVADQFNHCIWLNIRELVCVITHRYIDKRINMRIIFISLFSDNILERRKRTGVCNLPRGGFRGGAVGLYGPNTLTGFKKPIHIIT